MEDERRIRDELGVLTDAQLDQASRDEARRQIERDVAAAMLRERESMAAAPVALSGEEQLAEAERVCAQADDDTLRRIAWGGEHSEIMSGAAILEIEKRAAERSAQKVDEFKQAAQARREARQLARAYADAPEMPREPSPVLGQRRGSESVSKNQVFAELFADLLREGGLNAKARQTRRIQGRDVLDGWVVNVRDEENEVGIVASWWGRQHFACYFELAGHAERTEEAARLMIGISACLAKGWDIIERLDDEGDGSPD